MKKIIALIMVLALMLTCFAGCGAKTADTSSDASKPDGDAPTTELTTVTEGKLTMATNAYFRPYEYYDGDKIVGIDAEMAQAVADKLGMELKIEDMEFDSIINAVVSGKADFGVAGMTVTEERKLSVDFTTPYTTSAQVIIVQK